MLNSRLEEALSDLLVESMTLLTPTELELGKAFVMLSQATQIVRGGEMLQNLYSRLAQLPRISGQGQREGAVGQRRPPRN